MSCGCQFSCSSVPRRHPLLQLFKPVEDDVDLGCFLLLLADLKHYKPLTVRCHVVFYTKSADGWQETSFKEQPGAARAGGIADLILLIIVESKSPSSDEVKVKWKQFLETIEFELTPPHVDRPHAAGHGIDTADKAEKGRGASL